MSHSENVILRQSLIELNEFSDFEITGEEAGFVLHLHSLRNKRIREFTPSDLRVCLAQNVGRSVLLPIVLTLLEEDPWIEAEYYPGDLLVACARITPEFWHSRESESRRFEAILKRADAEMERSETRLGRQNRDDLSSAKRLFSESFE